MSTSSDASRKRTRTRGPLARSSSSSPGSSSRYSSKAPLPTTRATRSVVEPGARTRSATLPMRAGGRLSMTNHPRSSKVLAAFERPAPDSPVISKNSVISIALSSLLQGYGPYEQEPRDRGRVLVLLGPLDEAGRRRRLLHALDQEPGRGHGVDVPRQRAVDEGDVDVLVHLLDAAVFDEVGADAPVLLVEDAVVDPAAAGCLEQWVVEEEEEAAARREDTPHFGQGLVDSLDVLEHQAGDDGVERLRRERQGVGDAPAVRRRAPALACHPQLRPRRVEPNDPRGPDVTGQSGDLPLATADVEYRRAAPQVGGGHWHDLLDVFGVSAGGEPLLPPGRVLLPLLHALTLQDRGAWRTARGPPSRAARRSPPGPRGWPASRP